MVFTFSPGNWREGGRRGGSVDFTFSPGTKREEEGAQNGSRIKSPGLSDSFGRSPGRKKTSEKLVTGDKSSKPIIAECKKAALGALVYLENRCRKSKPQP